MSVTGSSLHYYFFIGVQFPNGCPAPYICGIKAMWKTLLPHHG